MCTFETIILGVPGVYLTSLPTTTPDACIDFREAAILGVIYTILGIIFAAIAGDADRPAFGKAGNRCGYGLVKTRRKGSH